MSTFLKILAGKGEKMKNVRVHFKKWEPEGKMEGVQFQNGNDGRVQFQNGCRYKIVLVQF
jgi:hypothetical protein